MGREVLEPVSLNLTDNAGQLYSLNQDTEHFNMNSLNQEFLLLFIRENNFETQPLERGDCNRILYSPALDNKWFSREVVYNMVAFISMFSSLLALYLSFLIQAFVIYCSKANDLFSAWNSRDVTPSSKRQFCLFFFIHECIGRSMVSDYFVHIYISSSYWLQYFC